MSKETTYISQNEILRVEKLTVDFPGKQVATRVLSDVDISIRKGEILGLVGASGSGKSVLARCFLRLESPAKIISGSIFMAGENLMMKSQREMQKIRGKNISLVPQNSLGAFDPLFTVGNQFQEVIAAHKDLFFNEGAGRKRRKKNFREKIYDFLGAVGISAPQSRSLLYPHQWSAGMRQRALIAMALCLSPNVLILDEVVSALDPTICLHLLDLILRIRERYGTSILFISHDMDVIHEICDRVAVMHSGRIVEEARVREIFNQPLHPYARSLVSRVL